MYLLTSWSVIPVSDADVKPVYVEARDFISLLNSQELRKEFLTGLKKEQTYIEPIFDTEQDGLKTVYKGVRDKRKMPFRVALPSMGWGGLGHGDYR